MIKKLSRVGNSQAIMVDKATLELLGIPRDGRVQLTVHGRSLVISPVDEVATDDEVRTAASQAERKYDALFRRLAK